MSEKEVDATEEKEEEGPLKQDIVEIGKLLKELRIKKELSIEDIQEITKIRSRYIQAIEEGNLERLPGKFYAKAFIKSYAEIVDLDPSVLEKYRESIPNPELDNVEIKPKYTPLNSSNSKYGKWLIASLVYVLIGLTILLVYMFYVNYSSNNEDNLVGDPLGDRRLEVPYSQDNQQNQGTGNSTNNGSGDSVSNEPEKEKSNIKIQKVSTSTFLSRPIDNYEIIAPADVSIKVKLRFYDDCWFDIREGNNNGRQLETGQLGNGDETQLFELKNQIWFHLGNASGVEIIVNDKIIKAGNVKTKYISILRKEK